MKKMSKRIITLVIMMAVILVGAKFVSAEDSAVKMSLSSSSKLKAGDTVTIDVNYVQSVEGGIGSIMGKLTFDTNVLEYVSSQGAADWQAVYVASTGVLGVERNNNTTTTGKIATITFKVKDPLSVNSTTIKYDISDVGLADLVTIPTSVTLNAEKTEEPKVEVKDEIKNEPKNEVKNSAKNIAQSKSNSKLPKTGDAATIVILAAVAVIAIIAIMGFVKYAKNKDIK